MKRDMGRAPQRLDWRTRAARAVWSSLLATLAVAGCLADIVVEEGEPAEVPPSEHAPLEPSCDVGEVSCNGQWLERCSAAAGEEPPQWVKVQDCQSSELCEIDPAGCREPLCRAGQPHCSGAIPDTCNGALDGYDPLGECVSAAHCSPDAAQCAAEGKAAPCCLEAPCEPGELRCNEAELQRCRDDQTDLDLVAPCATPELCELSRPSCDGEGPCTCEPPVCPAGATRCEGATLERCNAGQTAWEAVQPSCATPELCELGRSRVPLACAPPPCEPNEYNCEDAELQLCNAGQTGFEAVTTCAGGPGFCNEALGSCSQCNVGDTRCEGAQIEACRADRSGFEPIAGSVCATPELCARADSGGAFCEEPACDAEEFRCEGAQLERCNPGRTGFEPFGPPCLRPDLCSAERERCDFCFPSRQECTPDRTASRTCAADGNSFGPLTPCPLGCIPETGACRTCPIGQYVCAFGQLSRCDDGFSFTPLNPAADCSGANRVTCAGNTVQMSPCAFGCDAGRNACNECSAQVPASCALGLSCTAAGLCRCAPNEFTCGGNSLLLCNAAGTATTPGERCSGADDNVLRTCDAGVLSEKICGSAELCSAANGDACPICTAGEVSCASGELVACNASATALEPAAACAGSILRTCEGAELTARDCVTAALCLASEGGVCAECLPDGPPSCDAAGLEISCVEGQQVARECPGNQTCVEGEGCRPDSQVPDDAAAE